MPRIPAKLVTNMARFNKAIAATPRAVIDVETTGVRPHDDALVGLAHFCRPAMKLSI